MKALVFGMLAASMALTTLSAVEAAHPQAFDRADLNCPPGMAIDSQGSGQINGPGPCVRVQPNDVLVGGHVIGRDPDPFIRDQIRREHEIGGY